jgi:predicted nucleotidyltransferase
LQSVRGLGEPQTLDRLRRLRRQIEACASRHGAHDVRVFGSVAAGTAGSASDVDLLVRLDHGRTYSDIDALENELSELLGVDVDVLTEGACRGRLAAVIHQAVAL